ncbi:MAG: ABC transporter ATP-binding protein [Trueperaceae bacterium]|nr:ABC transporter ATP-binding protein [Trueperaceae bacterium]
MPPAPTQDEPTEHDAPPALRSTGLSKRYGATHALVDLDLEVARGEIFGFLGPNGAGKSTFIRLLLGFLHASAGSARVLGHDVATESVAIRRRVGYLPSGASLYGEMTGRRVLDYLASLQGRPPVRRAEACDRLRLTADVLAKPVRTYSHGMRQKLGLVQALQHDPELLILDEPSEGLDPFMQQALYGLLEDLRREGRTVFFSSHVLSEVERVCDRVAIVRAGRLMTVQDLPTLRARRRRRAIVRLRGPAPDLREVPGVEAVEVDGARMIVTLSGAVQPFVRAMADTELDDLTIEPARLEEAFFEYYAGGDETAPGDEASPQPAAAAQGSAPR